MASVFDERLIHVASASLIFINITLNLKILPNHVNRICFHQNTITGEILNENNLATIFACKMPASQIHLFLKPYRKVL